MTCKHRETTRCSVGHNVQPNDTLTLGYWDTVNVGDKV